MKIVTIGRGEDCNIRIEDPMVSRRHAVLRIHPGGKIEIIDYSANGTTVNGVRIGSEVLTRIKRGDAVTFAGVQKLDWKQIPNPARPIRIAIIAVIALIALIAAVFGVKALIDTFTPDKPVITEQTSPKQETDSIKADGDKSRDQQQVDEDNDAEIDPIEQGAALERQRRMQAEKKQSEKNNGSAKKSNKKNKENVQEGSENVNNEDNKTEKPKKLKVRG